MTRRTVLESKTKPTEYDGYGRREDSKFQMTFTLETNPYVGGDYDLFVTIENFERRYIGDS